MASSGLKKMLDLIILYTHKSVSQNVCPVIFFWVTKNQLMCHVLACDMPRQLLLAMDCGI